MRLFRKVLDGIDVDPLLAQVKAYPADLWGVDDAWTRGKHFPGTGKGNAILKAGLAKNNVVLRYNKTPAGLNPDGTKHWDRPPMAVLTEARPILDRLVTAVRGRTLGRVIISRMEPGEEIVPHIHTVQFGLPRIFHTFQIPLQVDKDVIFGCADSDGTVEELWMRPGGGYTFDNLKYHWVLNESHRRRYALMVDIEIP